MHFKRPPKTTEEAIETLKEVDQRFEQNRQFLTGPKGSLKVEDTNAVKQEKFKQSVIESIPDGVTVSRLVYPIKVNGKRKLSDIILLGVR